MRVLACLCCVWIVFSAYSQETLRFKHITRSNGSSITGVQSFHQDSFGYLWIGSTSSDLIRFDGTNFQYYSTELLRGARGVLTFEDHNQQLWVATDAGSLFKYNREKDTFILSNDSTTSPHARIYCFAEAPDGSFWLGSLGGGLVSFHPETKVFKQYKTEQGNTNSLPDNFITGLVYDDDGLLWVSTTGGLCSYNSTIDQFTTYPLTNINPDDTYRYRVIRSLHVSGNKIYLSTYGGLQVFDRSNKKSLHYIHNPKDKNSLSHNSTFKIVEAADGKFWIATYGGGLNLFDPVTEQFTHWKNNPFNTETLASNNLFSTYLDKTGLLWIGAADNTVSVHNPRSKKFHAIKGQANDSSGISSGWVRVFQQENDSVFWLGFNGQGLNKFNLASGKADRFINNPKDQHSLGYNSVSGLGKDANNNIWVALEGGGLNKLDPVTKKFTRYTSGKNSINNNAISALLIDSENMLWATAYRDGLNIYDIDRNKFMIVNNDSLQNTGISLAFVEDIFELNGNIWFNAQNQVVLYDKKRNRFVKVAETGRVMQVDNPFTLEIRPYTETEMLLITKDEARTIRYVNPDSITSESLFKMNSADGLKSFVIHNKEIWYVTYNQLVRWNPGKNKKHVYTQADGLPANELNSVFKDKQGRIFVTALEGFNWFYPDEITADTLPRKIVLTDFKLFNHSATQVPDSVYNFSIPSQPSQLKSVTLKHNHSFFSIEFAALEFIAPEKIQYAYRLRGFDNDWVYVNNRTFASYTNLDPGQYTFEVKSTNPDGYWNNQPTTLTLIISPPFWRTWWFIALVIIGMVILLYAVHRYRLAQSLKLERLRTKIASDLHDEVGSSLTKISIYSELVQNGLSEKEKATYLKSIGGLSREVVSTMSDIVWSIDNNNDTLTELINRMKDFATEVLEAKEIDFEFILYKAEGNKMLEPILRQNIYLIFKEAVNNAVKHSKATHLKISITSQPNFELRIEDNGIGLPQQQTHSGNGLRNMKRRAESIGGTISFSISSGTSITLMVP